MSRERILRELSLRVEIDPDPVTQTEPREISEVVETAETAPIKSAEVVDPRNISISKTVYNITVNQEPPDLSRLEENFISAVTLFGFLFVVIIGLLASFVR